MAVTSPTLAQLRDRIVADYGRVMADAGIYAPAEDGSVPVIDEGLARGLEAVGLMVADPLRPTDLELAVLSPFAVRRVYDEASRHVLGLVLLNWYRVVQCHKKPLERDAYQDGWLMEQKEAIRMRHAELKEEMNKPFRDAVGPVGTGGYDCRSSWHGADSPGAILYDAYGYPRLVYDGGDCP